MKISMMALAVAGVMTTTGCMTALEHQRSVGLGTEKEWTIGLVQKDIHPGMSQADVAAALGSPNIVSKDANGQEAWIYDKMGHESAYSNSGVEGGFIFVSGHSESGASREMQKTVTVVIKFNEKGQVVTTAYHATKF